MDHEDDATDKSFDEMGDECLDTIGDMSKKEQVKKTNNFGAGHSSFFGLNILLANLDDNKASKIIQKKNQYNFESCSPVERKKTYLGRQKIQTGC